MPHLPLPSLVPPDRLDFWRKTVEAGSGRVVWANDLTGEKTASQPAGWPQTDPPHPPPAY
jgi:hypothetical protein